MMNTKLMNKHELIAYKNITEAFNYYVGSWYNSMLDGMDDIIPDLKDAVTIVYKAAMSDRYREGSVLFGRAPKEMRFAGEGFCWETVEELFLNEDLVEEIWQDTSVLGE